MRLIAMVLAVVMAAPAFADKLSLSELSGYLNNLTTAKGEFTQVNDDGTISTGTVIIKRPGKMRFEYNPPDSTVVIAGSNTVVILDDKSNAPPESYPLAQTPLSIILARNVDLGRADMVTGHSFDGTATIVTAQDPEHPEYGNIQLYFTGAPVELRKWVINDGNGLRTEVVLGALQKGGSFRNALFDTSRYGAGR
ncbi:outer membrane lipoprotein carrier protein LolA [Aliishimia ponticola]|uniref:Outer membrane lipoprotein carrier protein LolA n=1 Tax=Aliishimia ponticola TaxID=2499833 RepID=A0A4S4NDM8_9RHOB|nr:outer membrane lipoprotein carrier protein LolA [Aliishimia ponticola]THH36637.1 outer membrane lipoprotein carrier protein LolA [Aliishimia ponticola]